MGKIKGTHHIALWCVDAEEFEKTVGFYQEVLGMAMVRTWDGGAMLDIGDGSLMEICLNETERKSQGAVRHFALATEAVDELCAAAKAAGYQISMEPNDIVIESDPPFPARIGFIIGPVGEEIELFCEK